jgi:hypothetical protein
VPEFPPIPTFAFRIPAVYDFHLGEERPEVAMATAQIFAMGKTRLIFVTGL